MVWIFYKRIHYFYIFILAKDYFPLGIVLLITLTDELKKYSFIVITKSKMASSSYRKRRTLIKHSLSTTESPKLKSQMTPFPISSLLKESKFLGGYHTSW